MLRRSARDGPPYGGTRVCAGIVGYADPALGAPVEKVLEGDARGRRRPLPRYSLHHRLAPRPGGLGLGVIRPASLLAEPKVCEGFARLAPLGLSFDAWMYHTQLGELVDLGRAFPATPIVLDH